MPNLIDLKMHNITFYSYSYANARLQHYFSISLISSKETSLTFDEIRTIILDAGCIDEHYLIPATDVTFDAGTYYDVVGVFCRSTSNSITWCYVKDKIAATGSLSFSIYDYKDVIYSLK